MVDLKIQLLDGGRMPKQTTPEAAGMDLYAHITEPYVEDFYATGLDNKEHHVVMHSTLNCVVIPPGETRVISAGFKMELPSGYEMQIRPRSGNSAKTKLRIANSPGTIDSDFRGNVGVIIDNIGEYPIIIFHGDRIAQGVIQKVPKVNITQVNDLSETERGENGFGSTGVK